KLIHHGADDNASGTAGVMELAEQFAANKKLLKRSVIFICFAGEELGLLGSEYFVKNSPIETEKMISMLNLDMVGRLNDENSLIVYGTGTSSVWKKLLNEENKKYNFKLSFNDEGYGPSDQTSFYGKQIPVLFFFTGTHTDYHRPSDVANKINFTGEVKILDFVSDLALSIIGNKNKPDYINVPVKDSGRARTFKVYLGTIPDFSYQSSGYKINGVNDGSPAQKGGIKAGDVMISFGGKSIANIYDYTYALGEFKPGDIVDVIVKRDGKEIKLKVELGAK
ncbi:MAG: M20/M25/M40 family metallo-hydrolase, partial [Bacteroidota bacterium]|nr:M20/M25/M40 family metallo-hydrolase [Bacteroidota bacterium]